MKKFRNSNILSISMVFMILSTIIWLLKEDYFKGQSKVRTMTLLSNINESFNNKFALDTFKPSKKINKKDELGRKQGLWIEYYATGKVKSTQYYVNDKRDGVYTSYYENGDRNSIVNFKMGMKNGDEKMFYLNGMTHVYYKFVQDTCIDMRKYDSIGNITYKEIYKGTKVYMVIMCYHGHCDTAYAK